jgi:hypothetical protein
MPKINWKIIAGDIKEAREQLKQIEKAIADKDYPSEGGLLVMLEHAYHHLNFAWNTRRISTKHYASMTDKEFNKWGKIPTEISSFIVPSKKTRSKTSSNKARPQRRAKGGA